MVRRSGPRRWQGQVPVGRVLLAMVAVVSALTLGAVPAAAEPIPGCLPGTYDNGTGCVPADPGFFVDVADATTQTPCPAGTYQPTAGSVNCLMADPGSYVPLAGSAVQYDCMIGYFQAFSGGVTCDAAPPGTYVDAVGATAATPCAVGTYQPNAGSASCVLAEPGRFVALEGAIAASLCAPGSYQPNSGATSCVFASPGFYVPTAGAREQLPCPAGETSTAGASSCTAAAYVFSGFGAPVDPMPTLNTAKAGRTIPLKFRVTTADGAPVTNLTSVLVNVASSSCAAGTADAVEEYAAGGSGLQNLGDGYYQFNWSTPTAYARSCRTLSLDLGDGVPRQAQFHFTR